MGTTVMCYQSDEEKLFISLYWLIVLVVHNIYYILSLSWLDVCNGGGGRAPFEERRSEIEEDGDE